MEPFPPWSYGEGPVLSAPSCLPGGALSLKGDNATMIVAPTPHPPHPMNSQESHDLSGKRVAILCTEGFEENELIQPRAALRKAGAETVLLGAPKISGGVCVEGQTTARKAGRRGVSSERLSPRLPNAADVGMALNP